MRKKILYSVLMAVIVTACKDKYNPGIQYPNTGYLVVEGFINSGQGATSIRLSRTIKISDTARIKYEQKAQVKVEGNDNTSYTLAEQPQGLYTATLVLNSTKKYRLRIKTSDGKEYLSDFATPIKTPPIDSISWTRNADGVQLQLNTHDPQNKTWYYTWNYEETWEFHSVFYKTLKYVRDASNAIIGVTYLNSNGWPDTTIYKCWQFNNSSNVLIGSSAKLSQDVIHLPLLQIENNSWKLSVLYSVKVYMHGVSVEGYDFLQRMKKNTEQVGSIFDAQPSELNSNIHCITQPDLPVIGFVEVADAQDKRIFISAGDVPGWWFRLYCDEKDVPVNKDSLNAYGYLNPVYEVETAGSTITKFHAASDICVVCTLRGTNVKPSYWP